MIFPPNPPSFAWPAALAGEKVHWFGRSRMVLEGAKSHALVQASLQAMNPEEPFYLLDDGKRQIPPLFHAMLNKCLAIPMLEAWSEHLWACGREQKLVALLNGGAGQGYAAWRVPLAPDEWRAVIQSGLGAENIQFQGVPCVAS